MKLTDFKTKSAWTIGILAIISLWIAFPLIFKYWVLKLLVTPPFTTEAFASLGPIGDIYGSLTALFTSATLIVVLYSAYLQREANKDTRQAMADQLQQARDATVKQLRQARKAVDDQLTQARESTAQQLANAKELSDIQLAYTRRTKEEQLEHARKLSDLQLAQAKESTRDQLALVQPTHDAQMLESKYAIFSNMFHALLSQKHERYSRIEVKNSKVHLNATEIFLIINETLSDLFDNEWKSISTLDVNDIQEKYFETTSKITGESEGEIGDNLSNLFLHLLSYSNLYELINRSEISEQDKIFFKKIVQDSMTIGEQVAMFWIAAFDSDMKSIIQNKVIGSFYDEKMMPFAVRFLDKSCFSISGVLKNWDKYL